MGNQQSLQSRRKLDEAVHKASGLINQAFEEDKKKNYAMALHLYESAMNYYKTEFTTTIHSEGQFETELQRIPPPFLLKLEACISRAKELRKMLHGTADGQSSSDDDEEFVNATDMLEMTRNLPSGNLKRENWVQRSLRVIRPKSKEKVDVIKSLMPDPMRRTAIKAVQSAVKVGKRSPAGSFRTVKHIKDYMGKVHGNQDRWQCVCGPSDSYFDFELNYDSGSLIELRADGCTYILCMSQR